jgi:uncharacterized membrane protein YgcG
MSDSRRTAEASMATALSDQYGSMVVGKNLTPLQKEMLRQGSRFFETGIADYAAIGSDNRRSRNLLNLLIQKKNDGEALPKTLSFYLATNRKKWTPKRALIWIAKLAQKGTRFLVADGEDGGFQMERTSVRKSPSFPELEEIFEKFGKGTVAELMVLRRFGYVPSSESRMDALVNKKKRGASSSSGGAYASSSSSSSSSGGASAPRPQKRKSSSNGGGYYKDEAKEKRLR